MWIWCLFLWCYSWCDVGGKLSHTISHACTVDYPITCCNMHNSLPYTKYTLYKLGRAVECLIESKYAMALLSSRDSFVAVLHFGKYRDYIFITCVWMLIKSRDAFNKGVPAIYFFFFKYYYRLKLVEVHQIRSDISLYNLVIFNKFKPKNMD